VSPGAKPPVPTTPMLLTPRFVTSLVVVRSASGDSAATATTVQ